MAVSFPGSVRRVALLVDGDNLPPVLAGAILGTATQLGRVDLRRVYAAEAGFRAWEGVAGFRAIRVGGAKNGTDLLLCIEAVELACQGGIGAFAVASNDRDFTHLAHWLRERGLPILGIGTTKAPATWRAACTEFVALAMPAQAEVVGTVVSSKPLPTIDAKIRDLIRAEGQGDAMAMMMLGARMGSVHKVTLASIGAANWRSYLSERPSLYALDPKGPQAWVRWISG
ncbi:NYN domain-containing protein [Rubellimicrobium rubrum]|uniref:NYN domain-containing protein n=1 Tax=Rubellimicrobium rubrum TaxID=2585369 RepID=UPI00159BEF42|nr:NYN domain-containing protein [Rubellimicrobium rubrum]